MRRRARIYVLVIHRLIAADDRFLIRTTGHFS